MDENTIETKKREARNLVKERFDDLANRFVDGEKTLVAAMVRAHRNEIPMDGVWDTFDGMVADAKETYKAAISIPAPRVSKQSRIRLDDSAVSSVIAVILMMAITGVLAATVFVLVSDISDNVGGAAPAMAFEKEGANLTVISAPSGLKWADFASSGCAGTPTGTVEAGDRFTGCAGSVTVRHLPSNSLVYQGTF